MRARGVHAACAHYGRGRRVSLRAGAAAAPRHGPKNGGTYCTNKDINGILIIRNTVEDDSSNDAAFEALLCPSPAKAGSWQMVSGTYTATSNSTTFALHSEGVKFGVRT